MVYFLGSPYLVEATKKIPLDNEVRRYDCILGIRAMIQEFKM